MWKAVPLLEYHTHFLAQFVDVGALGMHVGSRNVDGAGLNGLQSVDAVEQGGFYGGQWWLVSDSLKDVPASAYATAGSRGQFVIVVPSHDLVIVRRGLDFSLKGFDFWDLVREVVKAVK